VTVAGLDDQPVRGKKGHGPVPVDTTVDRVPRATSTRWSSRAATRRTSCGARTPCSALVRAFDEATQADRLHLPRGLGADLGGSWRARATSVGAIRDDMVNAGTDWVDEATVVDGNSSRPGRPPTSDRGRKALLKALAVG
jgi:protease I